MSYEEWLLKKETEQKLKQKLVSDTKVELHHEITRTLEQALNDKRICDQHVKKWIKDKTKHSKINKREHRRSQKLKKFVEHAKSKSSVSFPKTLSHLYLGKSVHGLAQKQPKDTQTGEVSAKT